jgi:sulfatase maturation enzyme AslB (radical SAM superfamily)
MNNDIVLSWTEDAYSKMVYVNTVPSGLQCSCRCPYCHEPLLDRQSLK